GDTNPYAEHKKLVSKSGPIRHTYSYWDHWAIGYGPKDDMKRVVRYEKKGDVHAFAERWFKRDPQKVPIPTTIYMSRVLIICRSGCLLSRCPRRRRSGFGCMYVHPLCFELFALIGSRCSSPSGPFTSPSRRRPTRSFLI